MSSWAAAEDSDSDEEVQQPVVSTPAVTESAPVRSTRPSKPAAPRECMGFMMGVRYSARLEDIEEFLRDNEVEFVRIDMINDRDGRFSGKAKVELVDDNALDRFLGLKGATFMDKDILTKEWEAERPRRDDRRDDRRGGGRGGGRGDDRREPREPREFADRREPREYADRREPREPREYASRPAPAHGGDARRFDNGDRQDRREAPRDRDFGDRDRRRPNNSSQGPRDRDDRRPRRDGDEEAAAPAVPAERPRVVLAPRTKPIEEIGLPAARPDIFGGGRPHDELEFRRRKEQEKATTSSADAGDNATGGYTITPPADDSNKKPAARKEDRAPRKEKEPRREKKEKKDRAPSTVDQDGALAAQLAAEEIGKLTVQSPEDADFTVVERSSKKKVGPPATAAGGAASSGASKKPIQNNSKGKGTGPPRQEQKPASAKGDGKKDKVGAKKEAAASAAPSSAPATGAAAAPSPKLSNTAFASLADDSDQDD